MKKKCISIFVLTAAIVFSFYMVDSVVAMAEGENTSFDAGSKQEQSISTGSELIEWLEAHKNTGGTVKLDDHITLDGNYDFCPNRANGPSVFVDTDKYTITVTGEVYLLSDDHLTFSGQPGGKGIFYVAPKGMLSIEGVTVKSEQGALWQEEGAGMVVSNCSVSGCIHYAATPFVTYYNNSICAVVEKEQTINDVLPSQLSCEVNRQGQLSHNELVSVSWSQEGSEIQQAERRRFSLYGTFLYAASAQPPSCTVVYNDYPLTFKDVEASVKGSWYLFKGWFTAPEESLPFTIMTEYSFDGENWYQHEERKVTDTDADFSITFEYKQCGQAADSNIYIRLKWNDNGTIYFSNVLCYASDDLKDAEDMGGSRGGGTSIINPPDEPQESVDAVLSEDESSGQNTNSDTYSDNIRAEVTRSAGGTESGDGNFGLAAADDGGSDAEHPAPDPALPPHADSPDTNDEPPSNAEFSNINEEQALYAETKVGNIAGFKRNDADVVQKEEKSVATVPIYGGNDEAFSKISERTLQYDSRRKKGIIIAAGAVLLSAAVGIAGCYVRSRSGTKR